MGYRANISKLFPKGFHLTDEELLDDLKLKVLGRGDGCLTPHLDVREQDEPSKLASMINGLWGRELKEWCFIRSVTEKYRNSRRQCRTTRLGYWKVTGKERKIRSEETDKIIGTKKTLVYYTGRVPNGKRTNWVMHELHKNPKCLGERSRNDQVPLVVCRLRNKKDKKGAEDNASKFNQEGDTISISNASPMATESEEVEVPISVSSSPITVTAESNDAVQDGSNSTSTIALEAEQAENAGKEKLGENYLSLEPELLSFDFDNLGSFCVSELFNHVEMGGYFTDDGYDWSQIFNWDEMKDHEDGGRPRDFQ